MKKASVPVVCFIICIFLFGGGEGTLKKVLVIFRHGDRSPEFESYPTDPHRNYVWKDGLGNLTSIGKSQALALGKDLRQRYQHFMSFSSNEVLARSSSVLRALHSTACVLIGLYKPNDTSDCYNSDSQQNTPAPIYTIIPLNNDHMLHYSRACHRLKKEFYKIVNSQEYRSKVDELQPVLGLLSELTGLQKNMTDKDAAIIYDILTVQAAHNLSWPDWAHAFQPELKELATMRANALSSMDQVAKLATGFLLNDLLLRITEDGLNTKLYLYGTHDISLMSLMRLMHVYNELSVPYAAALIVEVHNRGTGWRKQDYVEIYYRNSSSVPPYKLSIHDCPEPCAVQTFCNLTGVNAIDDPQKECQL